MRCEWRTRLKVDAAAEPSTEVGKIGGSLKGAFQGATKIYACAKHETSTNPKKRALYVAWPKAEVVVCLLIVSKIKNEIPQEMKKKHRSNISLLEGFLLFVRQESKMKFFSLSSGRPNSI